LRGISHVISDWIGKSFGKLTIVGEADRRKYANGHSVYQVRCTCSCGGEKIARLDRLVDGLVTTCGCGRKGAVLYRPIGSHRPEYRHWIEMKNRCGRTKGKAYEYYMKRGISVCQEWQSDFLSFYNHIGPRPTPEHTVDRIDNDSGYRPGNVRWATRIEQRANTRPPRKRKTLINNQEIHQ